MMDEQWMREAILEAKAALEAGETPVGCVIVRGGEIIARGRNDRRTRCDPTGHAEVNAIRAASRAKGDWRLDDCTLYVTLEPCPMCAGAILMSRMGRVVYGAPDPLQGCTGSVYRITEDPAFTHFCPADGGVLEQECAWLMSAFFGQVRGGAF